jgi:hypothetical protein
MSMRQDRIQEMRARQPQLSRHVRPPAGHVHHHRIPAGNPKLREYLEGEEIPYVLAVACNAMVWVSPRSVDTSP